MTIKKIFMSLFIINNSDLMGSDNIININKTQLTNEFDSIPPSDFLNYLRKNTIKEDKVSVFLLNLINSTKLHDVTDTNLFLKILDDFRTTLDDIESIDILKKITKDYLKEIEEPERMYKGEDGYSGDEEEQFLIYEENQYSDFINYLIENTSKEDKVSIFLSNLINSIKLHPTNNSRFFLKVLKNFKTTEKDMKSKKFLEKITNNYKFNTDKESYPEKIENQLKELKNLIPYSPFLNYLFIESSDKYNNIDFIKMCLQKFIKDKNYLKKEYLFNNYDYFFFEFCKESICKFPNHKKEIDILNKYISKYIKKKPIKENKKQLLELENIKNSDFLKYLFENTSCELFLSNFIYIHLDSIYIDTDFKDSDLLLTLCNEENNPLKEIFKEEKYIKEIENLKNDIYSYKNKFENTLSFDLRSDDDGELSIDSNVEDGDTNYRIF